MGKGVSAIVNIKTKMEFAFIENEGLLSKGRERDSPSTRRVFTELFSVWKSVAKHRPADISVIIMLGLPQLPKFADPPRRNDIHADDCCSGDAGEPSCPACRL